MKRILTLVAVAVFGISSLLIPNVTQAYTFIGIGDLPGGIFRSYSYGVSDNGSVVVGSGSIVYQSRLQNRATRWTQGGEIVDLGSPIGANSYAQGVSGDGSTAVGRYHDSSNIIKAARWTQSTGMTELGDLPGGSHWSEAYGVSANGSVAVGFSYSEFGREAFRWTQSTGMVGLGDLPGSYFSSEARAVSADGSVVVGMGRSALDTGSTRWEAFRWTESGGMVGLGLPGFPFSSIALGVSADGSVVVGNKNTVLEGVGGEEAFRWTQSTGMVGLGDLPGGRVYGKATGVSADGSVVVGRSESASAPSGEAFIWDSTNGMRGLKDVLMDVYGIDMSGWTTLYEPTGITPDGKTIVGYGNHNGNIEGWVANLNPVPLPSAALLFGSGLVMVWGYIAGDRRRRIKRNH